MKKIQISPSILSADFSQLGKEIKRLKDGGADMIHVDVMDGHFVPNLTIGPPVIKALKKQSSMIFDVHLMISPVHKYIEAYSDAGADIITIHPEATNNLKSSILKIKELNKKVGVSLNPETKVDVILEHLDKIDFEIENIDSDVLGDAYEYLIAQFASGAGKKAGEFYTPRGVIKLMVEILDPQEGETIYDPACGTGGMLLAAIEHVERNGGDPRTFYGNIFGQEKNLNTVILLNPKNEEAIYNLAKLKLDASDYQKSKELNDKLNNICEKFCNKSKKLKVEIENLSKK